MTPPLELTILMPCLNEVRTLPACIGKAQAFLARSADSPLATRFLSLYLKRAGERRRWSDFLALMPAESA